MRLRIEPVGRAVLRSLEVIKSRGQEFRMGRHSFRIIDGQGIEVYLDEGASGHGGLAPRRIGDRFGEGGARKGALTVQVAPC
ncbi:MAG: hypothetical protein HY217_02730 [Candidatus Rokubacteria bacterium]|nr:hypothetical protein [Candidatus Rokubacteria bacterium]